MISYTYKIFLKSIIKGSVYFVFAFILLLIPLNIGKKNLNKINTTVTIFSDVNPEEIDFSYSVSKQIWDPNYINTVSSIVQSLYDKDIKKVISEIVNNNSSLVLGVPNFYKNTNFYIDPDKYEYFRYEVTYKKNQVDDVEKFIEIFNQSFQNLIQENIKISTNTIIDNFERNEDIIVNEKIDMLNNYRLLNDYKNLNISIEHNITKDVQYPKIIQLDAQRYFVNINKKQLNDFFNIKIITNDYDWFRSKQYFLGLIIATIISILISMFFTMKIKKKL